jgi:hypothetical protein
MATTEMMRVYDLVLNGPGMSKDFKLSLPVSRRHLLLFCMLVENGLNPAKERTEQLSGLVSKETQAELMQLIAEMLKKGGPGLSEFYDRLKAL